MYLGNETKPRPWVLGLILVVHLLIGLMIFSSANVGHETARSRGIISGSSGGIFLAPGITMRKPSQRGYQLSLDREALVGPSTLPPPTKRLHATRKVAPLFHPS